MASLGFVENKILASVKAVEDIEWSESNWNAFEDSFLVYSSSDTAERGPMLYPRGFVTEL